MNKLTPRGIVEELDHYIVGQEAAKRAMAVALCNRERRRRLPSELRSEVTPKNMLMIGHTGVGKTEIARRIAAMTDAPFTKVEATRFTEVGYVGRDVESIISDLVAVSVRMVYQEKLKEVESKAAKLATERLIDYLCHQLADGDKQPAQKGQLAVQVSASVGEGGEKQSLPLSGESGGTRRRKRSLPARRTVAKLLQNQQLDDQFVEIEVGDEADSLAALMGIRMALDSEEMIDDFIDFSDGFKNCGIERRWRKVSVKEARRILTREESSKLLDLGQVVDYAIEQVEEGGVVFIDELDKLIGPKVEVGRDVSGEGVQRDLLPLLEGTTVMTKYGPVMTEHVLFLAAGSFYQGKPSELVPELQGRFPLRVELSPLSQGDLTRILYEPRNSLIKQYQALLETEGVELTFTGDAIEEIARLAVLMNERTENIGARRLSTIMEKILEELSFSAPEKEGESVVIDKAYVSQRIGGLVQDEDLSRYVL